MTNKDDKNITRKSILLHNSEFLPEVIKIINEKHTVTISLKGFSMRPFLEDGRDKALLAQPHSPLQIGDIVLAETHPGHYVLHRIININKQDVTLRGDGNILVEHCKIKDVKAFALGFYRKGRNTLDSTNSQKFKIYSKIWMFLFPIRRYLLAVYRRWVKLFGPI